MNWYNYVGNDPVNSRDPTGLDQCYFVTDHHILTRYVNGRSVGVIDSFDRTRSVCVPDGGSPPPGGRPIGGQASAGNPPPQNGHYYQNDARICTASPGKPCHLERTNTEACVLPGHISTDAVSSGSLYAVYASYADIFPSGVVRSTQTGSNSYRNTTTWAHPLSGTIDRIFSQDAGGNVNVRTIGQGTAATAYQDSVNQSRGPSIFAQQNQVCSAVVGGQ
jgi:hypothetical protein